VLRTQAANNALAETRVPNIAAQNRTIGAPEGSDSEVSSVTYD